MGDSRFQSSMRALVVAPPTSAGPYWRNRGGVALWNRFFPVTHLSGGDQQFEVFVYETASISPRAPDRSW